MATPLSKSDTIRHLHLVRTVDLFPIPPYNLVPTVVKPSHFPSRNVFLDGDTWYQALVFQTKPVGITMRSEGTVEAPHVKLSVYAGEGLSEEFISALVKDLTFRYAMAENLQPFYDRFAGDPVLDPVLGRWRGMQVSTSASLFEFLITTVVLQNATVRRTVQMMDNLITHYGYLMAFAGKELGALGAPDTMDQATEGDLRALKLGYRARTIRRLTTAFVGGQIDETELRGLETQALRKRLLSLYGIGPASVWYLLFEVFHRYDAFHHISPWEQKIFSRILFNEDLVESSEILAYVGERWAGWRTLAAHYLFENLFWERKSGNGPEWLDALIRL